jgi:hypothetical protein
MAITKKKDGLIAASWMKTSPLAPIVRSYAITVDTTAEAADIETGLDGYMIPVGNIAILGNIGAGTIKFTYNGTDLASAASPSATVPTSNTALGYCLAGTAAATAKLSLTTAGTVTAGTVYLTIEFIPLCSAAKTPGVGV